MDLFEIFMKTGRISDYLNYRRNLEVSQDDDLKRAGHPRTAARRDK